MDQTLSHYSLDPYRDLIERFRPILRPRLLNITCYLIDEYVVVILSTQEKQKDAKTVGIKFSLLPKMNPN
jgi:hypothetical protein